MTMVIVTVDDRSRVDFALPDDWPVPSGMIGVATYSTLGREKRAQFRNLRVHSEGSLDTVDTLEQIQRACPVGWSAAR